MSPPALERAEPKAAGGRIVRVVHTLRRHVQWQGRPRQASAPVRSCETVLDLHTLPPSDGVRTAQRAVLRAVPTNAM
jgi:hypothetical protein